MQKIITTVLDGLVGRLGKASPFAKALVPSVAGLIGAVANMALTGSFDVTSIVALAGGIVTAAVTYLVPNKAQPAVEPQPVKGASWDGSYPPPIPSWTPSTSDPALNDKDALDYLAGMVLGDQASSYGYVLQAAMVTVLRSGRAIQITTGD